MIVGDNEKQLLMCIMYIYTLQTVCLSKHICTEKVQIYYSSKQKNLSKTITMVVRIYQSSPELRRSIDI